MVLVGILRLVVAMLRTGIIPRVLVAISVLLASGLLLDILLVVLVGIRLVLLVYPTSCTGGYPTSSSGG